MGEWAPGVEPDRLDESHASDTFRPSGNAAPEPFLAVRLDGAADPTHTPDHDRRRRAMTHATAPIPPQVRDLVACPHCGRIPPDITPEGRRGTLLCLCRDCDVLWRVARVDLPSTRSAA